MNSAGRTGQRSHLFSSRHLSCWMNRQDAVVPIQSVDGMDLDGTLQDQRISFRVNGLLSPTNTNPLQHLQRLTPGSSTSAWTTSASRTPSGIRTW